MNENERIVCEFLRKIAPSREWEYLGEVEHYWIGELCDELNRQLEAENAKMQKVCKRMRDHIKDSCDVCDEYYCSSWDEDNECCVFDTYMRELGVEVNDQRNIGGTTDDLLPCPFCGGEAQRDSNNAHNGDRMDDFLWFAVYCPTCLCASTPSFDTPDEAVAAWNRRAES